MMTELQRYSYYQMTRVSRPRVLLSALLGLALIAVSFYLAATGNDAWFLPGAVAIGMSCYDFGQSVERTHYRSQLAVLDRATNN